MQDTLDRDRLIDNLIDQVFSLHERVARLEEQILLQGAATLIIPEPETGGEWTAYVRDMGGEVGPVLVIREVF